MPGSEGHSRKIRFGAYELDEAARELRKNGLSVRLQDQPWEVLLALLERPGEVVSREELQRRLWPDGTFVDYEQSLNKAVNKLRDALCDSADRPRYVVTVARRGYRFVAPVEVEGPKEDLTPEQKPARSHARLWWGAGALGIVAGMLVTGLWLSSRLSHRPEETYERLDSQIAAYDDPSFSADGKVLVFTSDKAGNGDLDVWVKYISTGFSKALTGPGADEVEPSLSADGTSVAYRSTRDGALYFNSTRGGEERRLAPGGRHPRFSPDGHLIAYWTGEEGNLSRASARSYVIPVEGGTPSGVLPSFADCRFPVWSPDGKSLLVTATPDRDKSPTESMDWWLVPIRPAGPPVKVNFYPMTKRLGLKLGEYPPHWAGDNVVFAAAQGETDNIWTVGFSRGHVTTEPTPITRGTTMETSPWSLEDGTVVYVSARHNLNIWSASLGSSQPRPERETSDVNFNLTPHVSSDGRVLLFTRRIGQSRCAWLHDRSTGLERKLPLPDYTASVLSRDGTRIVYSFQAADRQTLIEYQTDTAQSRTLCDDCGPPLDWSADGTHLVYDSGRPERIGILDLNTGGRATLIETPGHSYIAAAISPDQNRVAVVDRTDSDHSRILLAGIRNWVAESRPGWIDLTSDRAFNDKPAWSADGRTLYYHSTIDGFGCIWAQRFGTNGRPSGAAQEVLPLHSARLTSSLVARPSFNLAIGGGRLFVVLDEVTSTLWLRRPRSTRPAP